MKTSVLIVTYAKDFRYLKFCVRSLNKFLRGFHEVVILFPETDWAEFTREIGPEIMGQDRVKYRPIAGNEWPGKGKLWQMWQSMTADKILTDSDFIGHFDADCIFTGPITPETFAPCGMPILRYEKFNTIGVRHPGVLNWKRAAESCLPFEVIWECMRGHPEVYHFGLYSRARDLIELKTGMAAEEWWKKQKNEYPQTAAEYPTLGAVAMQTFPDKYLLVDLAKQENPDRVETPVIQFWSWGDPDKPQEIWIWGQKKVVVPNLVAKDYGLLDPVAA